MKKEIHIIISKKMLIKLFEEANFIVSKIEVNYSNGKVYFIIQIEKLKVTRNNFKKINITFQKISKQFKLHLEKYVLKKQVKLFLKDFILEI